MSAEQMQAFMTQIQHLVGVVVQLAQQQQHQQMQWQPRCFSAEVLREVCARSSRQM